MLTRAVAQEPLTGPAPSVKFPTISEPLNTQGRLARTNKRNAERDPSRTSSMTRKRPKVFGSFDAPNRGHQALARIDLTTWPETSVSRKSRPWVRYTSFLGWIPNRKRIVELNEPHAPLGQPPTLRVKQHSLKIDWLRSRCAACIIVTRADENRHDEDSARQPPRRPSINARRPFRSPCGRIFALDIQDIPVFELYQTAGRPRIVTKISRRRSVFPVNVS
jgi:hypothetical protein